MAGHENGSWLRKPTVYTPSPNIRHTRQFSTSSTPVAVMEDESHTGLKREHCIAVDVDYGGSVYQHRVDRLSIDTPTPNEVQRNDSDSSVTDLKTHKDSEFSHSTPSALSSPPVNTKITLSHRIPQYVTRFEACVHMGQAREAWELYKSIFYVFKHPHDANTTPSSTPVINPTRYIETPRMLDYALALSPSIIQLFLQLLCNLPESNIAHRALVRVLLDLEQGRLLFLDRVGISETELQGPQSVLDESSNHECLLITSSSALLSRVASFRKMSLMESLFGPNSNLSSRCTICFRGTKPTADTIIRWSTPEPSEYVPLVQFLLSRSRLLIMPRAFGGNGESADQHQRSKGVVERQRHHGEKVQALSVQGYEIWSSSKRLSSRDVYALIREWVQKRRWGKPNVGVHMQILGMALKTREGRDAEEKIYDEMTSRWDVLFPSPRRLQASPAAERETWDVLHSCLLCHHQAGDPEGAWRLFSRCVEDVSEFGGQSSPASVEEGRHPPMVIYELVIASIMSPKHLSASASTRSLQRAYRAIEDMSKRGMKPSLKICTSMAAGLSKLHQVDEALGWAERTLSIESFANVDVDNQNGGSAFTIQQESVGVLSREDTIILSALMGPLLKKRRSSPHHLQTVQTFFEAVTRTKEGGDAGVRDQEDRSPTVFENFEQNVDLFISRMIAVLPIDAVLLSMILDFYVRQGKISKAEQILRVAIAAEDHLINKCLHDLFPLKSAHDKRNRSTFPRDTRTDSRRDVVVLPRLLDASCYGSLAVGYLMLDRTDLVRSLVDLMLERGVEPDQYFASKWLKSMVESADFEAVREWWNVTAVNRLRGSAGRTMSPNPKASSTSISKHRGRAPSKLFREGTGSTAARDRRAVDIMDVTDQAQEVCFPKDLSSVRDPVVMSMVLNTFRRHLQRCGQLWQLTAGARNSPGPPSEKEDATSVRAFVDFEQELRRMLEDERARRLLFDRRVIVELLKLYSRNLPMVEHLWTQYTETMSTSEGDPVIITDLVGTNDTTGSQGGQVEGHTIANDNPFRQPPPAHQDARVYTALLVPYVMELRNIQRAQSAPSREVADHGDGCTSDDFDSYREHLVSRVNVILREMGEKSIELHVKMRKRLGQVGIDV